MLGSFQSYVDVFVADWALYLAISDDEDSILVFLRAR